MVLSPSYGKVATHQGISVWKVLSHRITRRHCTRGSKPTGTIEWSLTIDLVKFPTTNLVLPLSPDILFHTWRLPPRFSAGSMQTDVLRKYLQYEWGDSVKFFGVG